MQKTAHYQPPLIDLIQDICDTLGMPIEKIIGSSRKANIAAVRHICCYVAYHFTGYTTKIIGQAIGSRDHTTVISSRDKTDNLIYTEDEDFMPLWNKYIIDSKFFNQLSRVRERRYCESKKINQ